MPEVTPETSCWGKCPVDIVGQTWYFEKTKKNHPAAMIAPRK